MTPSTPTPVPFTERLTSEATAAAWLIFAGKSVEVAQKSLAAFLQRNLADSDPAMRAKIGLLLETKLGEVITALVLSAAAQTFGSTLADKVGVDPARVDRLASTLRVHALVSGGSALLDELTDPLLAQFTDLVRAMPPDEPPARLVDHSRVGADPKTEARDATPIRGTGGSGG